MAEPTISHLTHRADLAVLCDELKLITAVEIGTDRGAFARDFLSRWTGGVELWTVDPYLPYETPGIPGMTWDRDNDRLMAAVNLAPFAPRCRMLAMTSEDAAKVVPDPIHFVYIDGQHDRENVERDIGLWWPRLVSGGILAGHDYHPETPDVIAAVDAFCDRNGLSLSVIREYGSPPSWFVVRP